jgi:hypothetical protein
MQKLMITALITALGCCSPALAQHPGGGGGAKQPTAPIVPPPPPVDVHTPLCLYHNIYYSKGAVICIGTGWAQTCQPDGGWTPISPDIKIFSLVCGDAKSVPPS